MRERCHVFWSLAAAALVVSCGQAQQENSTGNAVEEPLSLPRLPAVERPLDRAAILLAAAEAASSAALGEDDIDRQRRLDGKRFEMRIRFGCPTEAEAGDAGRFSVAFEAGARTLRIRAAPDLTLDDPRIVALAPEPVEAAEGFWVRRPWLSDAKCPIVPPAGPDEPETGASEANSSAASAGAGEEAGASQPAAPPSRVPGVGIAQFFADTDARTGRRDRRAYEITQVLGAGEQPSQQGYNLVLSGRLRSIGSGRVILCRVKGVDLPPDCVVSAEFDRVWIERPDIKAILAEWSR